MNSIYKIKYEAEEFDIVEDSKPSLNFRINHIDLSKILCVYSPYYWTDRSIKENDPKKRYHHYVDVIFELQNSRTSVFFETRKDTNQEKCLEIYNEVLNAWKQYKGET